MATSFQNVNNIAGISVTNLSYGSAWGDFNGDEFPDLWVNNHFDDPGNFYLNQGNGTFTDVLNDVFIVEELGSDTSNSTDHHGAQWADFDNDGDRDLVQLVASAVLEPNLLFLNNNGVLRDVASERGVADPAARAQTPIWVDFNNDGLLDLVQTGSPSKVFRQTSNNNFEDVTQQVAPELASANNTRFLTLGDISGDGNLDLLVDGTQLIYDLTTNPFTNITDSVGGGGGAIDAITADFNGDLLTDVYLIRRGRRGQLAQFDSNTIRGFIRTSNSEEGAEFTTSGDINIASAFVQRNDIFIGSSGFNPPITTGVFREFTLSPNDPNVRGLAPRTEPGTYIGYNAGSQTWQVINFSQNADELAFEIDSTTAITELNAINFPADPTYSSDRLLLNSDNGLVDRTNQAGLGDLFNASNSVTAGDFDNDMDVDLYIVTTGSVINTENVFLDNQGDGTFVTVPNAGGATGSSIGLGDTVTTADYDLDGFLDLFVTNGFVEGTPLFGSDGPQQLFRNQGNSNNWLQIDLEGVESNRDGIGAQVFVTAGGMTQLREQTGGVHKWSQDNQRIHFGLAQNTEVDLLEIRWPSGTVQQLENIAANQLIEVVEETTTPNEGINGTDGRDTLRGTGGNDLINGLGNRDVLRGLAGNDTLNGGEDNDNLQGGFNNDVLNGDEGNDLLIGGLGNDTLTGGAGNDRFRFVRPDDGVDEITDFTIGNDTIQIKGDNFGNLANGAIPSSQFVSGTTAGDSNDRFIYNQNNGNLFFDPDGVGGDQQILLATLSNNANLSASNIVVFGGTTPPPPNTPPQAVNDIALTQQGQSVSIDALANDSDADNDPLSLSIDTVPSNGTAIVDNNGTPNNLLDDTITYTPNTNFVGSDLFDYQIDDGNGGTDTATVSVTVNSNNGAINGTSGRDTLEGGSEDDLINGLGDRDVLRGFAGNDTLNGNQGNDNLQGGVDNDLLNGGPGDDLLIGAIGNDVLTGGGGSDRFRFFRTDDGVDEITDFTVGEDTLQIKGSNFGGLASGTLSRSQFVFGTTAADSNDRFIYTRNNGNLFFDSDGVGGDDPVLLARLFNRASISASDIVVF